MTVMSMFTVWEQRYGHFMSDNFFGATEDKLVSFDSTSIEVTGENTAMITGDLTLIGVTKSIVLDAKLNQVGEHPMANKPWAGFDATTQILRSDFNLGQFAPFISDEVDTDLKREVCFIWHVRSDTEVEPVDG